MTKLCKIENCNNIVHGRGYCSRHYNRIVRRGNPEPKNQMHGLYGTKRYKAWVNMKTRCYNKKNKRYKNYGGRGIIVCDKWKNNFLAFYDDMGEPPTKNHQIDRINNDGNYEPDNCRWVTLKENVRNRGFCKIDMTKADKIRKMYMTGNYTYPKIANIFGVCDKTILRIVNNKAWS